MPSTYKPSRGPLIIPNMDRAACDISAKILVTYSYSVSTAGGDVDTIKHP